MLPIKDSSKGLLFRIAGMVVVHSLIQGGPAGLQILAPILVWLSVGKVFII